MVRRAHESEVSGLGVVLGKFGGDPILNIRADYLSDPRKQKIDASIGLMFRDNGQLFVPGAVQTAISQLHDNPPNTVYATPEDREREWTGVRNFIEGTAKIVFGDAADGLLSHNKLAAAGTAGGTMGLNVIAEAIKLTKLGQDSVPGVLLGTPPYPNHPAILNFCGLPIREYEQMTADGTFNVSAAIDAVKGAKKGSVMFLQLAAHNPTGINAKSPDDWHEVAQASRKNGITVVFDVPYAGFHEGLDEDTEPIRVFMKEDVQVAVVMSFSKTAGLYGERTACILVPEQNERHALEDTRLFSAIIRVLASSPPRHGEDIMAKLFLDEALLRLWKGEDGLRMAAALLSARRSILVRGLPDPFARRISEGVGMFSLLPISEAGVEYLKTKHGVYVVSLGDQARINIGGISTDQMPYFAGAVVDTLNRFST